MTSEKMCCVPFCGSQQQPLHKFPNPDKDPDRFRTWKQNIGGDILNLQDDKIFKSRRICRLHFESKFHTRSKLLSPNAVPTLNLSGSDVNISNVVASSTETDTTSSTSYVARNIQIILLEPSKFLDETPTAISSSGAPDATVLSTHIIQTIGDVAPPQQVKASDEVKISKHTVNVIKGSKKCECEKELRAEILRLKKENDFLRRRLKKAKSLSTNTEFQTALKKFKTLAAMFIVMQFREISKLKLGRRFTEDEKYMALSLYKMGPKAYRWLSNIFVLPSIITLERMVSRANLKPGINENFLEQVKERVQKMETDDRQQTRQPLVSNEMPLVPHYIIEETIETQAVDSLPGLRDVRKKYRGPGTKRAHEEFPVIPVYNVPQN